MKSARQNVILQVITENSIETQGQLIEELAKLGVTTTQATLSRDIKELQLVKEQDENGRYRYVVSGRSKSSDHEIRLRRIFRESVTSFAHAQNLVIIKTLPGLASAACSAIDVLEVESLVGTIAGDDTAFLAMKDEKAAEDFCRKIEEVFKC